MSTNNWGIYDANGVKLNSICVPEPWPANFWPCYGQYVFCETSSNPDLSLVKSLPILPVTPSKNTNVGDTVNLGTGTVTVAVSVFSAADNVFYAPSVGNLAQKVSTISGAIAKSTVVVAVSTVAVVG